MSHPLAAQLKALRHPDKNQRGRAAVVLGGSGEAIACEALLAAVGHEPDFFVREDITWALVRMGERTLAPLIALLRDENADVRHHAAHTLGKLNDRRALGALRSALHDTAPAVVSKAVYSIGALGDASAAPDLVALLHHPDRDVQMMLVTVLHELGPEVLPHLRPALQDDRVQVRELAADIAGLIAAPETLADLLPLLHDREWRVRFAAVTALDHIGGEEALSALRALPADPDARVASLIARVTARRRR